MRVTPASLHVQHMMKYDGYHLKRTGKLFNVISQLSKRNLPDSLAKTILSCLNWQRPIFSLPPRVSRQPSRVYLVDSSMVIWFFTLFTPLTSLTSLLIRSFSAAFPALPLNVTRSPLVLEGAKRAPLIDTSLF